MSHLNISKFFNNEASLLTEARRKCIEIHGSDIRAAGNEVEIAVRKWLERMLPDTVSVGHGHIIDSNSNISPQLDCILRDRNHLPTLFTTNDGTEYTPMDSVFSYGEIKSTYYNSSKYIEKFSNTIRKVKTDLEHILIENTAFDGITGDSQFHHILKGSPRKFLNQILTFMFFVDGGDATVENLKEIYRSIEDEYLPDIAVFLNGCVVIKAKLDDDKIEIFKYSNTAPADVTWKIIPVPKFHGSDATSEGKHLGYLYYCLLKHIQGSSLEGPKLDSYLKDLLSGSKSAIISIE